MPILSSGDTDQIPRADLKVENKNFQKELRGIAKVVRLYVSSEGGYFKDDCGTI